MNRVAGALYKLFPGQNIDAIIGPNDDYNSLVWNDSKPKPSRSAVESLYAEVDADIIQKSIDTQVDDLDNLIAKGFVKLIKILLQKNVIQVSDLPQDLVDAYQARMALRND